MSLWVHGLLCVDDMRSDGDGDCVELLAQLAFDCIRKKDKLRSLMVDNRGKYLASSKRSRVLKAGVDGLILERARLNRLVS